MRLLAGLVFILAAGAAVAQDGKLRVIAFGAHPDDADIRAGGVAAKFAAKGHLVKFVSVTNGDAGHCEQGGGALASRRRAEAQEAARRLGIAEYEVLDNHDGELMPSLEVRKQIIRAIRAWNADIVLSPRSNDYHPDHRYTSILVQDAAFMVLIPMVVTDVPPLQAQPRLPLLRGRLPEASALPAGYRHRRRRRLEQEAGRVRGRSSRSSTKRSPSAGAAASEVPTGAAERRKWLEKRFDRRPAPAVRRTLEKWYGPERAAKIRYAEAFEVCEYGRRPSEAELKKLFPFFD